MQIWCVVSPQHIAALHIFEKYRLAIHLTISINEKIDQNIAAYYVDEINESIFSHTQEC